MAIAFSAVRLASGTSTDTGAASPVTCPAPTGRAVNDVLICAVQDSGTTATITTPTGWSLIEGPVVSSTHTLWAYARIADGTSADDFSATITGPAQWLADMVAYSGCDTSGAVLTTAIVAHGNNFLSVAALTETSPSLTTPNIANCALVGVYSEDSVGTAHNFTGNSTTPSIGTPTTRVDVNEQTQKQDMGIMDAFGAAASTAYTMTANLSGSEIINCIFLILAPSTGVHLTLTASDVLNAILDVARPYRRAAFQLNAFQKNAFQTATGVALLRTAADTLSALSDSALRQATSRVRTASDSIAALSDTVTRLFTNPRTASDSLAAPSDSALRNIQNFLRTVVDTLGAISDTALRVATNRLRTANDSLNAITDSAISQIGINRAVSDVLGAVTDSASRLIALTRVISDSPTAPTDSALRNPQSFARTATDSSRAYRNTVLKKNPVGYWPLDDAGSTAVDISGNGNHGTINATGVTKQVAGAVDSADPGNFGMTFDGIAGKVDVPYASIINPPTAWSVEAWWFEPSANASNDPVMDCRPASSGALAAGFDLFLNLGAGIGISVCSTNVAQTIILWAPTTVTGVWHHTVATYDGTQVRLYGDGALRTGPTTCPYTPNPTKPLGIAHLTQGANFLSGTLDELAIYDRALTLAEIQENYNVGRQLFDSPSRLTLALRTASDALAAITETTQVFRGVARTAADTLSAITDSAVRPAYSRLRTANDSLNALTDSANRQAQSFLRTALDTLSAITESTAVAKGVTRTAADTLNAIADSPARLVAFGRTASDTINALSDAAVRRAMTFLRTASDTINDYKQLQLGFNPIAYYRLGESSGTTAFDVKGTHNGTITAGVALGTAGTIKDDPDTAMTFNGSTGRIDIPDAADTKFSGVLPFTIAVWVNPTVVGTNSFVRLVSKEHFSPNRFGILLFLNDAGAGIFAAGNRFNQGTFQGGVSSSNGSVPAGVWTRVVWTYDGVDHKIYINGVLNNTSHTAGTETLDSTTDAWALGAITGGGAYFTGILDEALFLNYALDAASIAADYQAGVTGRIADSTSRLIRLTRAISDAIGAISDTALRGAQAKVRTASDSLNVVNDSALRRPRIILRTALDFIDAIIDIALNISAAPIDIPAITWSVDGIGEVYSASGDDVWSADGTGEIITRDQH